MDLFTKEGTRKTPKISFDPQSGDFEISGRSFPEDAFEYYEDLFRWLDKYLEVPLSITRLTFSIDYFNSYSYRCFLELIRKLENIQDKNHEVFITWLYEKDDEEIREAGEDLKELTMLTIEIKELGSKSGKNVKNKKGA
jgi:hypothetical protein